MNGVTCSKHLVRKRQADSKTTAIEINLSTKNCGVSPQYYEPNKEEKRGAKLFKRQKPTVAVKKEKKS